MKMIGRLLPILAAVLGVALSACSANHYTVYRSRSVATDAPTITTIDAKQRVIVTAPTPAPLAGEGARESQIRLCAESSPDVFTVLAQAASGTGSFGKGADPAAIQAAATAAYSMSEQASTIARTQTINVLREVMYRTCERYLSGGLSRLELPVQAVRDQRLIVASLAIEQLTAAATPRSTTIGASSSATAGASNSDVVVRLDDAWKTSQKAGATLEEKTAASKKLEDAAPSCSSIKKKVDERAKDSSKPDLTADETTKKSQCDKADSELKAAKAAADDANTHYADLKSAAGSPGPASASSSVQAPGSPAPDPSPSTMIAVVAPVVQKIVELNYQQDEFLLLCLKVLSPRDENKNLKDTCTTYVQAGIERDSARLSAERTLHILSLTKVIVDENDSRFEAFWVKVGAPGGATPDVAKLNAAVVAAIKALGGKPADLAGLNKLKAAATRGAVHDAYVALSPHYQSVLLE